MRPPGAESRTGETIKGVEMPPGECNCISLHSTRSVHSWVGKN